jgi:hypothetical protein
MIEKIGKSIAILASLILIGCGGGGGSPQDTAPTPQLKISKDNKEMVYSTFAANIDDRGDIPGLEKLFSILAEDSGECPDGGDYQVEKIDDTDKITLHECKIETLAVNGAFDVKRTKDSEEDLIRIILQFNHGAITFNSDEANTTYSSGTITGVEQNGWFDSEEVENLTGSSTIGERGISFRNITLKGDEDRDLTLSGWVTSTMVGNQWFQVSTDKLRIDTDDNNDSGSFLFSGAEDTTMEIGLNKENVDVSINGEAVDHFTDLDVFYQEYDKRNEYFGIE